MCINRMKYDDCNGCVTRGCIGGKIILWLCSNRYKVRWRKGHAVFCKIVMICDSDNVTFITDWDNGMTLLG